MPTFEEDKRQQELRKMEILAGLSHVATQVQLALAERNAHHARIAALIKMVPNRGTCQTCFGRGTIQKEGPGDQPGSVLVFAERCSRCLGEDRSTFLKLLEIDARDLTLPPITTDEQQGYYSQYGR